MLVFERCECVDGCSHSHHHLCTCHACYAQYYLCYVAFAFFKNGLSIQEIYVSGIVYVLTNSAMPDLVKIGKTGRNDPKVRMAELYSTGVPVPFDCAIAVRVEDEHAIEKALHTAFLPYRINGQREFFKIDAEQATILLKHLGHEDLTPQVNAENDTIDAESRQAGKTLAARRPPMNFHEMGIPNGSILTSTSNGEPAEVIEPKKVRFRDETMSLTAATRIILDLPYSVQPGPHWKFQDQTVRELYDRTYTHVE